MADIHIEMLPELAELPPAPLEVREQVLLLKLDEPAEVRRDVDRLDPLRPGGTPPRSRKAVAISRLRLL